MAKTTANTGVSPLRRQSAPPPVEMMCFGGGAGEDRQQRGNSSGMGWRQLLRLRDGLGAGEGGVVVGFDAGGRGDPDDGDEGAEAEREGWVVEGQGDCDDVGEQ
jgi:hypothetical protein